MAQMRDILIHFSIKNNGDWISIYKDLENKVKVEKEELRTTIRDVLLEGRKIVTIIDEDYPEELKTTQYPPFVIIYNDEKYSIFKGFSAPKTN